MSSFKPGWERDDEPEWILRYRDALDGTRAKKSVWLTMDEVEGTATNRLTFC
jgi:hypothetical protein